MMNRKLTAVTSTFAAIALAATMCVPAFAASDPADDVSKYSYNVGKQAYEAFKAEAAATHTWFDNEDAAATANYSFHTGNQEAEARDAAYAELPADADDATKAAFYAAHDFGGPTWVNGAYDEAGKAEYSFHKGGAKGAPQTETEAAQTETAAQQ